MKEEKNLKKPNKLLQTIRKKVWIQISIAVSTVALMLVLIFAMSAAWFTNVVKAGDLVFHTAVWGFQGQVTLDTGSIEAGPGKSGVVSMEVNNTGSDMIFAGVRINKTMEEDLSKRIYLYVDAASTQNGETVEQVYLNSKESYSYLIPSQNKLILGKEYYNDARVMWKWVYDVVGYYFLGTVDQGVVTEEEYLRPVEYNLDKATFDSNGKLTTVDGSTSVSKFVKDLSSKDGYAGTIDTAKAVNGYYPVEVDANGKGVWLYLLSWAEIQQETETDVALGSAPEKKTGIVRLIISAQGGQFETTEVSTVTELQTALNSNTVGVIQLTNDLHLQAGTSLTMSNGTQAVLNLNGNTITTTDATPAVQVNNGGKLTVFDGTIQGCDAPNSVGIKVVNGGLTMSKVTVSNVIDAISVVDSAGEGQDSMVRLSECTVTGTDCALLIKGNGDDSGQLTQITIEKSTLHGDLGAIWGNGSDYNSGTSIQIMDSTVTGGAAAIYHPQGHSVLTISNSNLSGDMGLAIKGGTVRVIDTVITANGEGDVGNLNPGFSASGFKDIGSAVYLETNYEWSMSVVIEGAKTQITSEKDWAIRVNEPGASNASVQILGGTFNSSVAEFTPEGYVCQGTGDGKFVVSAVTP